VRGGTHVCVCMFCVTLVVYVDIHCRFDNEYDDTD